MGWGHKAASPVRVNGLMGHPPRWSKPEHLGVASGKKEASSFQCYLGPKQREAELSVEKQGRTLD